MNTQNNPEVATGTEASGNKGFVCPTLNNSYAVSIRVAGRLAVKVSTATAAETSPIFKSPLVRLELSEDRRTLVIPQQLGYSRQVLPLQEEVVEMPTPPWGEWGYDSSGCSQKMPGWFCYKSEMMKIISDWVKSVEAELEASIEEHVECGPFDENV